MFYVAVCNLTIAKAIASVNKFLYFFERFCFTPRTSRYTLYYCIAKALDLNTLKQLLGFDFKPLFCGPSEP
jgi:hypothetical protein